MLTASFGIDPQKPMLVTNNEDWQEAAIETFFPHRATLNPPIFDAWQRNKKLLLEFPTRQQFEDKIAKRLQNT